MRTTTRSLLAALSTLLAALAPSTARAACDATIDAGRGPVPLYVPAGYDEAVPAPLVVLLHGYAASGQLEELYLRLRPLADRHGFLYAYPDGSRDRLGLRFWNATDACCDIFDSGVDDSAYLMALIDAVSAQCNVDRRRIAVVGHSNGGFMAYRMACDHAGTIAAVASFAGATFNRAADCAPSEPVHVLQIHGTEDDEIRYTGGRIRGVRYPGAVETARTWEAYDGCLPDRSRQDDNLDAVRSVAGAETVVLRFGEACAAGGSVELWKMRGADHIPLLTNGFRESLADWLVSRPKCRGRERVKKAVCRGDRLKLKVVGGTPGDRVELEVAGGGSTVVELDERGKAVVRFDGTASGAGLARVGWRCGAAAEADFLCP